MKTIGVQSRVVSLVIATLLLLQISPALAGGPPDAQLAMTQGASPEAMSSAILSGRSYSDN